MPKFRYTMEERLAIGARIYHGEINRYQAAVLYEISVDTCRNYMRMYRASRSLPPKGVRPAETVNNLEGENT